VKCKWTVLVDFNTFDRDHSQIIFKKFQPMCDVEMSWPSGSNIMTMMFFNFWFYDRSDVYDWMTSIAVKELRNLGIDVILAQEENDP